MNDVRLFALLIDGDNIQASFIPQILKKIAEYGKTIIKKVYLNKSSLIHWEEIINEYSLEAIWVPNNTKGKNASDIALVIDAMDLLYNRENLTGFCIVSSDSDFTGLARYIVAKEKIVFGIGDDKTPRAFVNACSGFTYTEDLPKPQSQLEQPQNLPNNEQDEPRDTDTETFENLFIQAYEITSKNNEGWAQLTEIKESMKSVDNQFQSRAYQNGRKLAEKAKSLAQIYPKGIIEINEKLDGKPVIHYIRIDYDAFMFFHACKKNSSRERDGWMLLSTIGDALAKYPAYGNGFSYRGRKQLLKIVAEMMKDYPDVIDIREETDGKTKIYLIRVK